MSVIDKMAAQGAYHHPSCSVCGKEFGGFKLQRVCNDCLSKPISAVEVMAARENIMSKTSQQDFIDSFKKLQEAAHQNSVNKGFWDSPDARFLRTTASKSWDRGVGECEEKRLLRIAERIQAQNDGEKIALMHSELSEALEGLRHGNPPSDHIPEFSAVEEELADVIIRIMDYAQARSFRVAEAVVAKMEFNSAREHKHGGKAF